MNYWHVYDIYVYSKLLFECVANRLHLCNFSGNACLIIERIHIFCIPYILYNVTLRSNYCDYDVTACLLRNHVAVQ